VAAMQAILINRGIILGYDYEGCGFGIKEFIPFPCLVVWNWVWGKD